MTRQEELVETICRFMEASETNTEMKTEYTNWKKELKKAIPEIKFQPNNHRTPNLEKSEVGIIDKDNKQILISLELQQPYAFMKDYGLLVYAVVQEGDYQSPICRTSAGIKDGKITYTKLTMQDFISELVKVCN